MTRDIESGLRSRAAHNSSAIELVQWLKSALGPDFGPFNFVRYFYQAFNIPLQVLREAENWSGISSRGTLTDDEFCQLIDPYISSG